MYPEGSALPLPRIGRETLVPALICAGISVILMRVGFFALFFLVPLGLCAVVYSSRAAWLGALFAILGNGVTSLGWGLSRGIGAAPLGLEILYFTVLSVGFTWIMAGNPATSLPPVRTLFRFIAAAVAGTLAFFAMTFYTLSGDGVFSTLVRSRIETIAAYYIASSGGTATQQASMEQLLTPDRIIDLFLMVTFRGGALVSAFFLLFFNRLMSFLFGWLIRRQGRSLGTDLIGFFVPRKAIWALSLSLPAILLFRFISVGFLEIVAWNLLVMCAIMYFAQGSGVVLFHLARTPMPAIVRLLCIVLLVILILSPGVNVLGMGIIALLGIVEHWLPMRAVKENI